MAKPAVWGLLLAVLALAAAAVEAGSRKALSADRLDSGLYVQCDSRDPACLQAEVVALRKRLYKVSREYGSLACKHTGIGPTGAPLGSVPAAALPKGFLLSCAWRRRHNATASLLQSTLERVAGGAQVVTRHDPLRLPSLSGASLAGACVRCFQVRVILRTPPPRPCEPPRFAAPAKHRALRAPAASRRVLPDGGDARGGRQPLPGRGPGHAARGPVRPRARPGPGRGRGALWRLPEGPGAGPRRTTSCLPRCFDLRARSTTREQLAVQTWAACCL